MSDIKHHAPCPGCGETIGARDIACQACYRLVPGPLKQRFADAPPGTTARKRVVTEMRAYLSGLWVDHGPAAGGNAS